METTILNKITGRMWAVFIIAGLVGQFAWTIENMYFNVYLYNTISTDPFMISAMVAASAVAATATTLLMGALSDKSGRRKIFICGGYIIWGLSTASFGFITVENAARWFPAASAVYAAAVMVIVMDCIMTFFGSTANDAAFNAYITDSTAEDNRGRVESVLATLPLISMLVIFGGFDFLTQQGKWQQFFSIFGLLVTLTGIALIFIIKEKPLPKKEGNYFANIIYGFRPSVIKSNKILYIALCALCVFSVAVQIFLPYLIIYIQNYLKIDNYALVLGIVLIFASVISVLSGKILDKKGRLNCVLPAGIVFFAGLLGMFFARGMVAVIIAGCVMMSGYMILTAILSATVRDFTPKAETGLFQGIRMIFAVMLPMIIGPFIGAAVIGNSAETYTDLGVVKSVPTPYIFLAAAVVLLVVIPFVVKLKKSSAKDNKSV